jgi:hypothetical protein
MILGTVTPARRGWTFALYTSSSSQSGLSLGLHAFNEERQSFPSGEAWHHVRSTTVFSVSATEHRTSPEPYG